MRRKPEIRSNLFEQTWIDLSIEANKESQSFTSKLVWENIILKLSSKLHSLATIFVSKAIKNRLSRKIRQNKPISPNDLLAYRSEYWEIAGKQNYKKICDQIELHNGKELSSQKFSRLFLNELLNHNIETKLVSCPEFRGVNNENEKIYLFFDSFYLFRGGHLNLLEQTIDTLQAMNKNIVFVFLLDKRMILFASLAHLIIEKCMNKFIFDTTNYPIRLMRDSKRDQSISLLVNNNKLDLPESIISTDCILNPMITWAKYPYTYEGFPEKSWGSVFTRDESKEITSNEFKWNQKLNKDMDYVVIHIRNSSLMSDNMRNTKPLVEHQELIEGLINMGLRIVVLGVMEPKSKFRFPGVYYLDELGPISDDIQIHILRGALAAIGSPSGITHLTYCTDTPLLLLDVPFPFCNCYPASNMKALLKRLKYQNDNIGLKKYYSYNQQSLLEDVRNNKAFSPLTLDNIELECNADAAVLHAFCELLVETYHQSELSHLNININDDSIDFTKMKIDHAQINKAMYELNKRPNKFPYFQVRDLSTANWYINT